MTKLSLLYILITILLHLSTIDANPLHLINARHYHGTFRLTQQTTTSLNHNQHFLSYTQGKIKAIFSNSSTSHHTFNLELRLLDGDYEDGRSVVMEMKNMRALNRSEWLQDGQSVIIKILWRKRIIFVSQCGLNNSFIIFQNIDSEDYEQVLIKLQIQTPNIVFNAELAYHHQLTSTLLYDVLVLIAIIIQCYSAHRLLKFYENNDTRFSFQISLITLAFSSIQDFEQAMTHIQHSISEQHGYLFILPSLGYILMFIFFDMKLLFISWQQQAPTDSTPSQLNNSVTYLYLQFFFGLIIYITINYIFANQPIFILTKTLVLLPQILLNSKLPSKPYFNKDLIFGYIGSRLLIPLYERCYSKNLFNLMPNMELAILLVIFYMIITSLLLIQQKYGSKFFYIKFLMTPQYSYHPPKSFSVEQSECSICLQKVQVGQMMLTPCKHTFHEYCLSEWMKIKLQCPSCRGILPQI